MDDSTIQAVKEEIAISQYEEELSGQRDRANNAHIELLRHCTSIASTLIGIMSVFGSGVLSTPEWSWCLSASIGSLLLSVLTGIAAMAWLCWLPEKLIRKRREQAAKGLHYAQVEGPAWLKPAAKACPILLCLGIVLCAAKIFLP